MHQLFRRQRAIAILFAALPAATGAPLAAQTIFMAARDGDLATVRQLVEKNPRLAVNGDANGITPLHWAAGRGRADVVLYLLEHGAKVDARDRRSYTTLKETAEEESAPPGVGGNSGGAAASIVEPVKPGDPPDAATPLHWAAAAGHLQVAQLLLDHGASVKVANVQGMTALHHAALYGHADVAELLLKYGAPVNAESQLKRTPLFMATMCDWPDNGVKVMKTLMQAGADVHQGLRRGAETLRMAANHHNVGALRILLDAGVDPNIADEEGRTPLHEAAYGLEPVEMIRLMLEHGADANVVERVNGDTPLLSLRSGGLEGVKLLVDAGAHVDVHDRLGNTPLHNVAKFDSGAAMAYLIGLGLDPNAHGYGGGTALHNAVAAWKANPGALLALIHGGADVNARDDAGQTPLHVATLKGKEEMVALLMENGAVANLRDKEGNTPFAYAVRSGNTRIAELLRGGGR